MRRGIDGPQPYESRQPTAGEELHEQGIALQSRLIAGGTIDAHELETFQLESALVGLRHRTHASLLQVTNLLDAARAAAAS